MKIGTPAQQALAITSPDFVSWCCAMLNSRGVAVSQLDSGSVEFMLYDAVQLTEAFEQLDYNLGPWAPHATPEYCGLKIHRIEDGRWGLFFSERADLKILGLFITKKEAYREYAEITRAKAIWEMQKHIKRIQK